MTGQAGGRRSSALEHPAYVGAARMVATHHLHCGTCALLGGASWGHCREARRLMLMRLGAFVRAINARAAGSGPGAGGGR